MKVELINHTPNPEQFIAFVARISNPDNQDNPDYAKLIAYLIKNNHWSPFEHAYFTFQITTSRAIAAQILRHRSFTFQEFSQRYSAVVDDTQTIEIRKQAKKNRQSSEEVFNPVIDTVECEGGDYDITASRAIADVVNLAFTVYQKLLAAGVAKESARMVLPLATTTTLYMTGSARSWIHYLALRNDEHTQKEHQLIAQEIERRLREILPYTFTALDSIRKS